MSWIFLPYSAHTQIYTVTVLIVLKCIHTCAAGTFIFKEQNSHHVPHVQYTYSEVKAREQRGKTYLLAEVWRCAGKSDVHGKLHRRDKHISLLPFWMNAHAPERVPTLLTATHVNHTNKPSGCFHNWEHFLSSCQKYLWNICSAHHSSTCKSSEKNH